MKITKKTITITILTILTLTIIVGGFWYVQDENHNKVAENQNQENNQVNKNKEKKELNEELDFKKIDTSNWKIYCNQEYGFCVKYPEDKYVVNEESGMIHFYYHDGSAPAGSQKGNYINISISEEKNPQGVETLYELLKYDKNNPGVKVSRIRKETILEKISDTQFIVTKFYNNEIFYSILFVTTGKKKYYYKISFGNYWNIIKEDQYIMIMNMIESFKKI